MKSKASSSRKPAAEAGAAEAPAEAAEVKTTAGLRQYTLAQLSNDEKARAMQIFVPKLRELLRQGEAASRQDVMTETGKAINGTFDVRQFDNFLSEAFKMGYLDITLPVLTSLSAKLTAAYMLDDATVVGGSDERTFAWCAARVFLQRLQAISERRGEPGPAAGAGPPADLHVGLVSGSTVKIIIDVLEESESWLEDFGVEIEKLPKLIVFALNVSPTEPTHINFNATILAPRLAAAIIRHGGRADAYGLNAPVVVTEAEKDEIDQKSQTRKVLAFTEPSRVDGNNATMSKLDVILTSAGDLNPEAKRASIFRHLAEGAGIDIEGLKKKRGLVGDLGFQGLSALGETIDFLDDKDAPLFFYSAASLEVFAQMARDKNKAVILAARGDAKWRIILASIGHRGEGRRSYVNTLVIDQPACGALVRYENLDNLAG